MNFVQLLGGGGLVGIVTSPSEEAGKNFNQSIRGGW